MRSTASFSMSISGTEPQRRPTSFLILRRVSRLVCSLDLRQLDRAGLAILDLHPVQLGQSGVQGLQLGPHFGLQFGDEVLGVQGFAQLGVVLHAARGKIGGQVLLRVAKGMGADHPDLLAPQGVAQCLEGDDLVHHPHHPPTPTLVVLEHQVLPRAGRTAVLGHVGRRLVAVARLLVHGLALLVEVDQPADALRGHAAQPGGDP
ncbi:hypothetical protein OIE67_19355 [Nonomuraea fuscirosea]|uniref:hypothetical protein n=1 Tax=Nonomuraea fuscirosea TaxID=1291556 RepID=UPI002DD9F541|nr:hypothetical protein [Nonomuraea fuscirosea]WSA56688.1 hypothetical protein OIE67_19355 [Nonomuraea fuscirosea]